MASQSSDTRTQSIRPNSIPSTENWMKESNLAKTPEEKLQEAIDLVQMQKSLLDEKVNLLIFSRNDAPLRKSIFRIYQT